MKNFKKAGFIMAAVFVVLVLSSCGAKKSDDLSVESVFPKDATTVFALDYTDEDQVENFNDLLGKFPDIGLGGQALKGFNEAAEKDGFSWEEDVAQIFEGQWSVAFSLIVPEEFKSMVDLDAKVKSGDLGPEDLGIYLAGKFENSDAMRSFIDKMIDKEVGDWAGAEYEQIEGVDYWNMKGDGGYLVGYGDLFFITPGKRFADEAVNRLKNGGGFSENQKFLLKTSELAQKNFGYIYLDGLLFNKFYKKAFASIGDKYMEQYFASLGDMFFFWSAEEDGFRLVLDTELAEGAKMNVIVANPDYKLALIDKVNADGVFMFVENPGLAGNLDYIEKSFIRGFELGLQDSMGIIKNEPLPGSGDATEDKPLLDSKSLQTSLLNVEDEPEVVHGYGDGSSSLRGKARDIVTAVHGIFAKIKFLIGSPMAFAVSDSGGYLPTMSFYFQLKDENKDAAKKLLADLDDYADEIIKSIDENPIAGSGNSPGLLKKDLEVVGGGGLHKLYLDWEALPKLDYAGLVAALGKDFKKNFKMEFYYGLTDDNVFVVALYPDFSKTYGKNAVSEDKDYLKAIEKLGEVPGMSVSYTRTKPLIDLMDRWVAMLESQRAFSDEEIEVYESKVKPFIEVMQYLVGTARVGDDGLTQSMFLKIK